MKPPPYRTIGFLFFICSLAFLFLQAKTKDEERSLRERTFDETLGILRGSSPSQGRKLIKITSLGGSPPPSAYPLQECYGDCDENSDCAEGLVCFQKGTHTAVPGCIGGEDDESKTDYCIRGPATFTAKPTPAPQNPGPNTSPPGNLPPIRFVGNDGRPPSAFPMGLCESDCDHDGECAGSLICFQRRRNESVPGCQGGENELRGADVCVDPAALLGPGPPSPINAPVAPPETRAPSPMTPAPQTPAPQTPAPQTPSPLPLTPLPTIVLLKEISYVGNDGSLSRPLRSCESDCDSDDDCESGLICYQRTERYQEVPGCLGGENERSEIDVCINPSFLNPPGTFRLKLYWEQGYYWQEETREVRRWCATFDYNGRSCWYGLDSRDCNSNEMYISKCNRDANQLFHFIDVGSDEVLVQLGNQENRCWERYRRSIYLRPCDVNNPLQRWYAPSGNFNGDRFELSQKDFDTQCVTTAHHPKEAEVVELHSCRASREDSQTSFWNKYEIFGHFSVHALTCSRVVFGIVED